MLSDFDRMLKERLPQWGRWGRQDCGRPDPEAGSGSIYSMGKKDERELDEEAAPEPPPPRIDTIDCEMLDRLIFNLERDHRNAVKDFFYKRRAVPMGKVFAAVRAVLDAEYKKTGVSWAA